MFYTVIALILTLLVGAYFWDRNNRTYKEVTRVIDLVSSKTKEDITNNRPWKWRYEALDSISYTRIFLTFWKPVESFYKDHPCLK